MSLKFPAHPKRRPALVTGASSGIGRESALALAAAGHPVAVGARRVEKLDALVAEIRESGGEAFACALDVTDTDSVAEFVARSTESLGAPEVLLSSAGSVTLGRVWEVDESDFLAQVDIHLLSVQRLLRAVVPGMIERRRGDLVLISSDTVYTSRPRSGAYPAAKAGLENMIRQVRRELEGSGVRVSTVRPGPVMSEMGSDFDPEITHAAILDWAHHGISRHPRMSKPRDLAHAVLACVSMPRGSQIVDVEVQPEAPIEESFR